MNEFRILFYLVSSPSDHTKHIQAIFQLTVKKLLKLTIDEMLFITLREAFLTIIQPR